MEDMVVSPQENIVYNSVEAAGTAPASRENVNRVSTWIVRSLFFGYCSPPDREQYPQLLFGVDLLKRRRSKLLLSRSLAVLLKGPGPNL